MTVLPSQHLAEMPVYLKLGKAVLASGKFGCVKEVLRMVVLLSPDPP